MHIEYEKEPKVAAQNLSGQLSSVPWWNVIGTQSYYGRPVVQWNSSSMEPGGRGGDPSTAINHRIQGAGQGIDRGNATHLGDGPNQLELQAAIPNQSCMLEYQPRLELGFGQHMGRLMLPLNTTTDEGPIYVNAKQYHGIIRRRQCRAKADLKNKAFKERKSYMHESRHLHALRRPRGCGGRFLNTKKSGGGSNEIDEKFSKARGYGGRFLNTKKSGGGSNEFDGKLSKATESQNSNLNEKLSFFIDPETNGSNNSGSEVTSVQSLKEVDFCLFNAPGRSSTVSDMMSR